MKTSSLMPGNNAECVKLILDLQKVSRTVISQVDNIENLTRPLTTKSPATSAQLLKFANSDYDEAIRAF